ncbi:hypothetical protein fHeYen801_031 [Yersinia phage fHe-Yen8-01]|nr:hypothetical protein fHeYen801_031 [Yersinia phage fHe-Yen8-01]
MSEILDLGGAVVRRKMLPWLIVAALVALLGAGGSGLYFGYKSGFDSASLIFTKDQIALVEAQRDALNEKEARRRDAEARSQMVETNFLTALKNMQIVNKTYNNTVQKETEKLVYTDCKLPDSGREILMSKAKDVNAQFVGIVPAGPAK